MQCSAAGKDLVEEDENIHLVFETGQGSRALRDIGWDADGVASMFVAFEFVTRGTVFASVGPSREHLSGFWTGGCLHG